MIDESPLDAFMFGIDHNDQMLLALDLLHEPPPNGDMLVTQGREALYHALHPLRVPSAAISASRFRGRTCTPSSTSTSIRTVYLAEHRAERLHALNGATRSYPRSRQP